MKIANKLLLLSCVLAAVFQTGCAADLVNRDFKTSMWEDLWLDGADALSEKRLVDARRILESAVQEARGVGSNMRLGISLDRLGDAYTESEMLTEAEKSYNEAIAAFDQSIKDDKTDANEKFVLKEQIGSLSSLANVLVKQKKYQTAEKCIGRAIAIAQRLGGTNMSETRDKLLVIDYGSCLQTLGMIYEATGRNEEAQQSYIKASHNMAE
jgi:tetratricopeptide (TPR) repeat protein